MFEIHFDATHQAPSRCPQRDRLNPKRIVTDYLPHSTEAAHSRSTSELVVNK